MTKEKTIQINAWVLMILLTSFGGCLWGMLKINSPFTFHQLGTRLYRTKFYEYSAPNMDASKYMSSPFCEKRPRLMEIPHDEDKIQLQRTIPISISLFLAYDLT